MMPMAPETTFLPVPIADRSSSGRGATSIQQVGEHDDDAHLARRVTCRRRARLGCPELAATEFLVDAVLIAVGSGEAGDHGLGLCGPVVQGYSPPWDGSGRA